MNMTQLLISLVEAGFPALAVLVSILLLLLALIIKMARWTDKQELQLKLLKESIEEVKEAQQASETRVKEEQQASETRVKEAQQASETRVKERIGLEATRLDGKIDGVSLLLNTRIGDFREYLGVRSGNSAEAGTLNQTKDWAQSKSPVVLTAKGEEVAKRLKLREMLERVYPDIKHLFITGENDNAYDIQQRIHNYFRWEIEKHWTPQELKVLKDEAYIQMHGVEDLYYIMGLLCRDKVLAEYKIKIAPASLRPQDKYLPASGGSPKAAAKAKAAAGVGTESSGTASKQPGQL